MQEIETRAEPVRRQTARWVAWNLIVGAVLLLAFAWFLHGFLAEPSAVGRSRAVLDWLIGSSIGSAAAGVVAAAGLLRRSAWAWGAAVFASSVMILTCAGAVIGVPALLGLWTGRPRSGH